MAAQEAITPVILAGGHGTRLWPLSRGYYPKQFLALDGEHSLLQQALVRLSGSPVLRGGAPLIVCNEEHRFLVAEQARQMGRPVDKILLEPMGRNTAPALTAAAVRATHAGGDPLLLMMPADHVIVDGERFRDAVSVAAGHAVAGCLVTFGVIPTRPETGFGYIERGDELSTESAASYVLRAFKEKPDAETARAYIESGNYLWNAGIFLMKASIWLAHARRYCPDIVQAVTAAVDRGCEDGDFFRLDTAAFAACPSDSIDYAVMEPLAASKAGVIVVALAAGWSDVGSWSSLWDVSRKDSHGNVLRGDVCAIDAQDNLIFAEHRLVAALGCDNLVVVETADAVMVADKSRSEDVKAVVDWLSQRNRGEQHTHRRVFRPWGSYENIDIGSRFQVKHITVKPGAALSLQMHHHRAEHWIVVSGTARVTRGDEVFLLTENESTYIPIGITHRLENPGTIMLDLIEVQSGRYLGEDDIVRFEDHYNRVQ